ncbi:hypothetical protein GLAREA_02744 [Glarea lozoyensis ATCC 20868]|uniref:Uncharacterized protein n=1 Tax=Glarea lozoyensis (strain ATCC 20868 / MF5171) TaxID=1116229 RepID=S3CMA9_GLAL2|nr:uncharacterized protein GLAREA_02744 [Glarea lozoyensis ATCC 20868]EPE26830.1 hypothetical protein GLAREA_02744 [Glarea lozoyensis ATCC 20868]
MKHLFTIHKPTGATATKTRHVLTSIRKRTVGKFRGSHINRKPPSDIVDNSSCTLLQLPEELQVEIFSYACTSEENIKPWSELSEQGFWFLQANANLRTLTLELRNPVIALYQTHNPPPPNDHFVGCVPGYWLIIELRNLENLTIDRGESSVWQLERVEFGERQFIQYPSPESMVEGEQVLTDLEREMYEKVTLTDRPTGVPFWCNKDEEVPEEQKFAPKFNITTRSKRLPGGSFIE